MSDHLPEQFRFSHEYSLYLNDMLSSIVVEGGQARIFEVEFALDNAAQAAEIEGLSSEAFLDWLTSRGHEDVVEQVLFRQSVVALLSDFCHFVFEGLSCSRKGKLTVAYALLRKPLKDNLFYLEWILADLPDFLKVFRCDGPVGLERTLKDRAKRLAIIKAAVQRAAPAQLFDAEFIETLRYDKSVSYGFASLWDQANHLITTHRHLKTDNQNFNFIFSGDDGRMDQWRHIYERLPMLLNYAVHLVEALVGTFATRGSTEDDPAILRRDVGFLLWSEDLIESDAESASPGTMEGLVRTVLPDCPGCLCGIPLSKENLRLIYEELKIKCPKCSTEIQVGGGGEKGRH